MADFDIGGIKELGGMELGRISGVPGKAEITVDRYGTVVMLPAQYYIEDSENSLIRNTLTYNQYVVEGAYCGFNDDALSVNNPHLISSGDSTFEFNNKKGDLYCVMKQDNVNVNNVDVQVYNTISYQFIFIDENGNKELFINTPAHMQPIEHNPSNPITQTNYYNSVGDNRLNYCYLTELVSVTGSVTSGVGFAPYTGDINKRVYVDVETFYKGQAKNYNVNQENYYFVNFTGVDVLRQGFINLDDLLSNPDFSYTSSGTGTFDNSSDDIGLP